MSDGRIFHFDSTYTVAINSYRGSGGGGHLTRGAGIPKEDLSKIFDPVYTTKEKGTGLGLAVSYDIIKKMNGSITVESEVGKGTVFTVTIPCKR